MEEHSDIDVIEQVLGGQKNTYRFIVDKYQKPIFSLMVRVTGSREDAEELTQETFMKAYAALHRFDTNRKFFSWLYAIGLNLARDWKRKDLNQPKMSFPLPDNSVAAGIDPNPERVVTRKEDMAKIQKGLAQLPMDHREAVILRFRYELSIREISEIFNISMSASKMRVHRGLKQLKEVICHGNK